MKSCLKLGCLGLKTEKLRVFVELGTAQALLV